VQRILFTGWMGPGPMSGDREAALLSIVRNAGCAHVHLTRETLASWIDPAFPFHPAFAVLSAVHQCDYLRCYMLHVHGGGYTDVKHTSKNWHPYFDLLERSPAYGVGYTEVGPQGVARVGGALELEMQQNYHQLVGVCAMVMRPRTDFTREWFSQVHRLLDDNLDALMQHPARHPQDRFGAPFTDGTVSQYPLAWTAVGGDIFHPLAYQHRAHILHADLAPSFTNYR